MKLTSNHFIDAALRNPVNAELASRLPHLGLSQCFLTAGCLFQATWNSLTGQREEWGVKDYDVFYFDDTDLSWEAEDAVINLVQRSVADLGVNVEVRNQARVHLWYEQRFGVRYPQLTSTRDGIDRYLISCTCVGIDMTSRKLYAPDGLDDLASGVLRMNLRHPIPDLFRRKAHDYKARWPWLTIVP